MTVAEYLATPETVLPRELIYGEFRAADAPLAPHQRAVKQLFLALNEHVTEHNLGEVWLSPIDVILDPRRHLVVQPDLLFVSHSRGHIVLDRIRGAPDLVVEVLSPNPRIGATAERVGWFASYGVAECWLVHQLSREIEVLTFANGTVDTRRSYGDRMLIESRVLPGFSRGLSSIVGSG